MRWLVGWLVAVTSIRVPDHGSGAAQCSAVQCSAVLCSAVQCSAVSCRDSSKTHPTVIILITVTLKRHEHAPYGDGHRVTRESFGSETTQHSESSDRLQRAQMCFEAPQNQSLLSSDQIQGAQKWLLAAVIELGLGRSVL